MSLIRRGSIAVLGGIAVAGTVGAAAASLGGLSSSSLGSDDAIVASCDSDGIVVAYTTAWDATDQRYEVSAVSFSSVAAACNGLAYSATLSNGSTALATASGTVSLTSGAFSAAVSGVAATAVVGTSLVISG